MKQVAGQKCINVKLTGEAVLGDEVGWDWVKCMQVLPRLGMVTWVLHELERVYGSFVHFGVAQLTSRADRGQFNTRRK